MEIDKYKSSQSYDLITLFKSVCLTITLNPLEFIKRYQECVLF